MTRIPASLLLAACFAIAISGCCAHKQVAPAPCPPYQSQRSPIQVPDKPDDAGVTADFGAVAEYKPAALSAFAEIADGSVKLTLQEAACIAATNSVQADLIEAERHALSCQTNDRPAIDMVLQGESLEQRNLAAGSAAELFLRLVEIQLQRELANETNQHLDEWQDAIDAAASAGFATADASHELALGRTRLKKIESELNSSEQILIYQLNLLLNPETELLNIVPVHELVPTHPPTDYRGQIELVEFHRPGILALQSAVQNESNSEAFYQALSQFDALLGLRIPRSSTKRLLRRQLREKLAQETAPDNTLATRRQQFQQVIEVRIQDAKLEATEASFQLQRAAEKLAIIQEAIDNLETRREQLQGKQKIDALDSFVELNLNWIELQKAKSERLTTAIDLEIAKFKLLQAQGQLIIQCGYPLPGNEAQCECNEPCLNLMSECESFPPSNSGQELLSQ